MTHSLPPNFDISALQSILVKSKAPEDLGSSTEVKVEIPPLQEWRFELNSKDKLKIKLLKGEAEIFGTELSPNVQYTFQGSLKSSISSFKGCTISYDGCVPASEYVSDESCLSPYLNLHLSLEKMRRAAVAANSPDLVPRVLIIGNKDSGKTSLSKILSSYAERMDHIPLLVNLDTSTPQFVVPGSMTATAISDMFNVENINLGETITTGVTFYHQKQPLVKTYGLENRSTNLKLYKYLLEKLGQSIGKRISNDPSIASSGIIVDTPSFSSADSDLIQFIVEKLNINVLVVIGNERFLVDLKKKFSNSSLSNKNNLNLIKVNKSGGVVDKDEKYEREILQRCIREYFYGFDSIILSPYTFTTTISELIILKPVEVDTRMANLAFLSGDMTDQDEEDEQIGNGGTIPTDFKKLIERVENPNSAMLSNAVLSIVSSEKIDFSKYYSTNELNDQLYQNVLNSSTIGFGYVSYCNDEENRLKLLVPLPVQQLPSKILILTQFRYHE
ncbi:unnamed protein product [[Candida] boidinii]|uniref:Polynucleotide 5'-hydroxyl-kinase GRC3 n=1 Tax=Candida boidinii TaxID=5477 RepID=A0A9W6STG9_CANBO|nr:hypothetical protein B5S30_g1536 [[Candida] boidinii]GME66952.1 unnamed protein product [[Candida] boidinii]